MKIKHLPIGLKCTLNYIHLVVDEVMHDVNDTKVYLDDVGAVSHTWDRDMLLYINYTVLKSTVSQSNQSNANEKKQKTTWLLAQPC